MIHVILVTKYRRKILYGDFRNDVKQSLYCASAKHHWYVKRMETDGDHVHILLQYNPTDSVTTIIATLKQYSTYDLWNKYHEYLIQYYWKKRILWSDGYFAATIGQVSQTTIEHYIESQG